MGNTSRSSLWIASGNIDKSKELVDFSKKFFPDALVTVRGPKDVVENQPSFQGNAKLKAHALVHELIGEGYKHFSVLGDDSGLCVDLLDGKPGVLSGRYYGPRATNRENVEKLLLDVNSKTQILHERTGQYQCALWLVLVSDGVIQDEFVAEGIRKGLIALNPTGSHGYAYDSIFLDPQTLVSYGDLSYSEKQLDSHRYRAFAKLSTAVESAHK